MPPSATPLVTPADLFAWLILAPLAVMCLSTMRDLQRGQLVDAQRYASAALVVSFAGVLSIAAWAIWGAP